MMIWSIRNPLLRLSAIALTVTQLISYMGQADAAVLKSNTDDRDYGLMIDAGSSGSRLYAYYWPSRSVTGDAKTIQVYPVLDPETNKQLTTKITPGISSVKPADVAKYLEPLVKKAIEYIPAEKQANTPIYLKATAGMRLLPTEEREAIIEAVINYFSDKSQVPFKFDPRRGAQVIPGEDEGVYGWLTVNALDGRLNRLDKTTTVYPMTAAALDLGGASTQITFEPRFAPLDHAYRSRINGTVHTLYTHSYLRLGADVALQRYAESLVKKGVHVKGGEVNDPCNFRGFVNEVKLSDGRQVKLRGTGQFHQCRKLIRTWLLGLNSFCAAPPCAINGIHSPNIPNDMPIYAISSYYFSTQDLGCGKPGTLSCVMNAAQKKCSLPASQADQAFPSSGPFVKNVCFNNALLIELLSAYHISPDHPIHFVSEINNSETNWSLGAMIDEVNELAYLE